MKQIDWLNLTSGIPGLPLLSIGNVIQTNYGTGPYRIERVDGPCTCSGLECFPDLQGEEHFHLVLTSRNGPVLGLYWLGGYRSDGSNVWSSDRIELAPETRAEA